MMNNQAPPIRWNDWARIFFGEVPAGFYIEVVLRTLIIYVLLMTAMRLMGKRMASQLGQNETIAMVCLAAAIGIPMQAPDRGLIPAFIIGMIVVVVQQVIASKAARDESFEALTQDNFDTLVSEGVLQLDCMLETRLTRERIFGQLRNDGIHHLGEVKRVYLEANGTFTIIRNSPAIPGLSVIPPWDEEFLKKKCRETGELVCHSCGTRRNEQEPKGDNCEVCGANDWMDAVL
ncbi:DUF421 domain-containing protein [Dyadobacter sandarakinus]|uniref:DUF421 domain-containing protein n=1 Tax=Dyadobacter sandarakinus TaxID=2747268 RepID=A0ABX7I3I6_9BACT|nr:YetF domain-containing protein [Dyadobacter sandarakinus]QRR00313.1 DUF421 domain-containing protein [Dyadobacter sandarakinus]